MRVKFQPILWFGLLLILSSFVQAAKVVNVYVWGGEIPKSIVQKFEKETGIRVNFSTYDSNETMFSKLKASRHGVYDVVMPSGYYVERMKKLNMLLKLDSKKLPNLKNIQETFKKAQFDRNNHYSAPINWGATGIFLNKEQVKAPVMSWKSLWNPSFKRKLLLLDDAREVFSMALLSLGYSANDTDPAHIKQAFEALLSLSPNIKVLSTEGVQAIMIDGDAAAGSAFNGDAFKAQMENSAIEFVYPSEGFVIWVDCLAIPTHAPHKKEAYTFINYMLQPESGVEIALKEGHASANAAAIKLLPASIKNNPVVYPPKKVMQRATIQQDIGEETLELYNEYWQKLKLSF